MKVIKKLARNSLIILLILVVVSPLWFKNIPTKFLSSLTGRSTLIDKLVCSFSTKVGGESMYPLITSGSLVKVNRCFVDNDLIPGMVILFNDGANQRIGIIRHILPLDPVVYKVSDEKASKLLFDVIKKDISGVIKNIDVSKSQYQIEQETKSFILNTDDYLLDLYLAKIPKGMGIESSALEKTTIFYKNQDKFCTVLIPKQKISSIDTEIISIDKQKIVSLGENIVFDTSPSPNINCLEFGIGQGMLNLNQGTFQYRFLLNHQVLSSIIFEVK